LENGPTLGKLHSTVGRNCARFFLLKDSTVVQVESLGVAKVLQSEKNTVEILDAMDISPPKKCKNPDKNAQNGRIGSSEK